MSEVITGDAFDHVPGLAPMEAVFTSLPDAAEVGGDVRTWLPFFEDCVRLVIDNLDPAGTAIFYQTDRRHNGGVISKACLVMRAAEQAGAKVLWHKIMVRTTGTSLYRPGFSHLIAVSKRGRPGPATPDVIMAGKKNYPDATDEAALQVGFDFLGRNGVLSIVDPFAGRGSIGREAQRRGIMSTSIEIDPDQAKLAVANIGGAK